MRYMLNSTHFFQLCNFDDTIIFCYFKLLHNAIYKKMKVIKYSVEGEDAQIITDFRNQVSFLVENLYRI